MKKLSLFLILSLSSLFSFSQEPVMISPEYWSTMEDSSAFDGKQSAAYIIGTCYDGDVITPLLSVVRSNDQSPRVYLAYFPIELCGETVFYLKFDQKMPVYRLSTEYYINERLYVIKFDSTLMTKSFIDKLKVNRILHTRMINSCSMISVDVDFMLTGAKNALELIEK